MAPDDQSTKEIRAESGDDRKPIINEIASVEKDITRDYIGKVLLNPDKILKSESGGKGVEIYEDMLTHHRIFSETQKRILAVIGKEWEIIPASEDAEDQKIADFVKEVFSGFPYDSARQALLTGVITGFKPGEIMWDYSEGDVWVREIRGRSPRRFTFDLQGKMRLLTWGNMVEGEELPDRKFITFTNPSANASPFGDGLGRPLYWCQWFAKNGVKFWAVFLEKFGQPTPWGKYPPGTAKADQDKLLDCLEAMQTEQCIITPDNMTVELLEAARTSSVDSYDAWMDYWDKAITLIILGQTATTEGTPGKLGAETERAEVRQEIVKADADLLCELQNNTLIPWLVDYNFPKRRSSGSSGSSGLSRSNQTNKINQRNSINPRSGYPKVWIRTEPEQDLKALSERDRTIVKDIGLPVSKKYFYETYAIPEPEGDEELITVPQTTPALPAFGFAEKVTGSRFRVPGSKLATRNSQPATFFAEVDDWIADYMARLSPALKKIRADAVGKVEAYLRSKGAPPSEEEFIRDIQELLGSAYNEIDKAAVIEAVSGVYGAAKGILEVGVGFGGPDVRAIEFLSSVDRFYLSKFLTNPDARDATYNFLRERYLEGGEGLFGRGDPKAWREMANALSQHMTDLEGYQVRRIVETGVVRAQNWGHISQLHDGGVVEIEIVEPTQECGFCAEMDGKVISVDVAFSRMEKQAAMTPEEYEEELRNNRPDLESIEAYVEAGLLPPYHPHCRGRIIKHSAAV